MSILSLGDAPKIKASYYWADYIELLCLDSLDNIASIDTAAKEAISQSDNCLDTELVDDDEIAFPFTDSPEFDDKTQRYAEDGMILASKREMFFGDYYPFQVNISKQEIALKGNLSFENRLYISLLLCSNHDHCSLNKDVFTLGFEKISKFAFKGILPPEGKVLHLGTRLGGEDDVIKPKTNKIYDKIDATAKSLRLKNIADSNDFSSHNTGDGGIDLVGYVPMPEADMGQEIVSLAQSATTKSKDELKKKQNDASFYTWNKWIKFFGGGLNILFMSASIRQSDGKFIKGFYRQADAILIDRNRVIAFISCWRKRSQENSAEQIIPNEIEQCITELVS